jgi:hypothetical protein
VDARYWHRDCALMDLAHLPQSRAEGHVGGGHLSLLVYLETSEQHSVQ